MRANDTHETLEPVSVAGVGLNMDQLDALLDNPIPDDDEAIDSLLSAGTEIPDDDLVASIEKDVKIIERQNDVLSRVEAEQPTIRAAEGDEPVTSAETADAEPAVEAEPTKGKKGGRKKAATPKEPKVKEPKPERLYYHSASKSAVLLHKIGGARDVLNLELADFTLSKEEQTVKQDAILAALDADAAKKVGEKAVMLLTGKAASQEVLKRAFTVLARDGYLTSGDKGNLQVNLLAKPYSLGTARSQANQIFALFPLLKITARDGKGRQVPNLQSTVLANVLRDLGLTLKPAA
jgi:hypothetical protein